MTVIAGIYCWFVVFSSQNNQAQVEPLLFIFLKHVQGNLLVFIPSSPNSMKQMRLEEKKRSPQYHKYFIFMSVSPSLTSSQMLISIASHFHASILALPYQEKEEIMPEDNH